VRAYPEEHLGRGALRFPRARLERSSRDEDIARSIQGARGAPTDVLREWREARSERRNVSPGAKRFDGTEAAQRRAKAPESDVGSVGITSVGLVLAEGVDYLAPAIVSEQKPRTLPPMALGVLRHARALSAELAGNSDDATPLFATCAESTLVPHHAWSEDSFPLQLSG